jgi:hypothetical protein
MGSLEAHPQHNREAHNEMSLAEKVAEAEDRIDEMFETGKRPIVTVPRKYIEALRKGLCAHATWIPDLSVIAGTLGRGPYISGNEDEPRIVVEILKIPREHIHPRLTGPNKDFNGVVILDGPIPPESLKIMAEISHYN